MKILINLIGGQTAPNFIAAKHYNVGKVLNIYSKDTKGKSEILNKTIGEDKVLDGYQIEDPFDVEEVKGIAKMILSKYSKEEIILNFTGGTKPMSIGCFYEFLNAGVKIIYIDSQKNKIYEYVGESKNIVDINCNVSINDHFRMYGHNFVIKDIKKTNANIEEKEKLKNYLKNNYSGTKSFIGKFAKKYNNDTKFFKKDNSFEDEDNPNSVTWIKKTKDLKIRIGSEEFNFKGDNYHKYFTGLWFEDLVLEKFDEFNPFDELKCNLAFPSSDIKNGEDAELDIVAAKGHNLYIFEVKSGVLMRDYIYKLSSIKNLFSNLYAKIYFITFEDNSDEKFKSTLKAFNIGVISYKEINNFLKNIK